MRKKKRKKKGKIKGTKGFFSSWGRLSFVLSLQLRRERWGIHRLGEKVQRGWLSFLSIFEPYSYSISLYLSLSLCSLSVPTFRYLFLSTTQLRIRISSYAAGRSDRHKLASRWWWWSSRHQIPRLSLRLFLIVFIWCSASSPSRRSRSIVVPQGQCIKPFLLSQI